MGGCQNYGPRLGTLIIRGRIIIGTQKGTIILTTTLMTSQPENGTTWAAPVLALSRFSLLAGNSQKPLQPYSDFAHAPRSIQCCLCPENDIEGNT